MHRLIMNKPRGRLVDHRNCNPFDNRRQNLRAATNSQNQQNKKKTLSKCTSKYKGVRLLKDTRRSKPWQANILAKKKMKFLGNYSTEIEAAKAYDRAAKKYYGDFARLNFPELTAENAKNAEGAERLFAKFNHGLRGLSRIIFSLFRRREENV